MRAKKERVWVREKRVKRTCCFFKNLLTSICCAGIDTFVKGFHKQDTVAMMPYRQAGDRMLSVVGLGCSSFSDIFGEVRRCEERSE